MIFSLSQQMGDYIYDVFVQRFDFWLAFGIVAQLIFTARFLVQWIASERQGRASCRSPSGYCPSSAAA